jgi:RNA polymerase sigma factor (sigma-70 family)
MVIGRRAPASDVTGLFPSHPVARRVLVAVADDLAHLPRDGEGFDRLYTRYHGRVYGFLHRLARRRDLAEDLVQETWLRLARGWSVSGGIADLEAWLFTIARNVFLSQVRADATSSRTVEGLRHLPPGEPRGPEQAAQTSETMNRLEAAFEALSDEDRTILLLVAVEGLDQQQVASVLGIGHAAARQRVFRARGRLAEQSDLLDARAPDLRRQKGPRP